VIRGALLLLARGEKVGVRGRFRWVQIIKLTLANLHSVTLRCSAEGRASKGDGGTVVQPPPFEARALRGHLRVTAQKSAQAQTFSRRAFAPELCQPRHVKREDREAARKPKGWGPGFSKAYAVLANSNPTTK
jgi:hypothetical protein